MPVLTTFPAELLLNIFEGLPAADLARAKRVCKIFNDIGKRVTKLSIKFYVDAPNQGGWKLVRSILADSTLGERVYKVSVRWRRRDAGRKKSLTRYWQWTPEEKEQIQKACANWQITTATEVAILAGVNSEALLPLLLCLTPNIRIFKTGKEDPLPMSFDPLYRYERRWVQAFNSCLSEEDQGFTGKSRKYYDDGLCCSIFGENTDPVDDYGYAMADAFRSLAEKHVPPHDNWGEVGLWFYENIATLGENLPWFRNLKNVKVFCERERIVNRALFKFGHFCPIEARTQSKAVAEEEDGPLIEEDSHAPVEDDLSSDEEGDEPALASDDEPYPADEDSDTTEDEEDLI